MGHTSIEELIEQLEAQDGNHINVLDEDSMTVEVGRYQPNTAAPKNPHTEDELYYIVSGSGKVRVGDETHAVETGDFVYVEQGLEHDFFNIEEEITVIILFAGSPDPAAYSIRE